MEARLRSWWSAIKANPCGVLMVAQLLALVLYPLVDEREGAVLGRVVLSVFGMVILVLALGVARMTPALTWVSLLLGVPTVILTVVDAVTGNAAPWHLYSSVCHVAFYGYTFVGLLRYMLGDEQVTTDELWGVGATFTVALWTFAYLYDVCQILVPGSFIAAVSSDSPRTWVELLFLSCTSMTSTGLSDIVPIKPMARALVSAQMIAGVLYVAMVVSRLVSLAIARRGRRGEAG